MSDMSSIQDAGVDQGLEASLDLRYQVSAPSLRSGFESAFMSVGKSITAKSAAQFLRECLAMAPKVELQIINCRKGERAGPDFPIVMLDALVPIGNDGAHGRNSDKVICCAIVVEPGDAILGTSNQFVTAGALCEMGIAKAEKLEVAGQDASLVISCADFGRPSRDTLPVGG